MIIERIKVVVHTLRHTFASHLAINGTPIFTIQKLMNHSDINMTLRYAKLAPESGRDSILNLNFWIKAYVLYYSFATVHKKIEKYLFLC